MNWLPRSGSAADELYETEKCNRQLEQSSVNVTWRTGVTTGKLRTRLESRCLEWLAVFNLYYQFVKYRIFKTYNSVFVSKALCFSVCEKWPCLYCITTLTVQLNTFHSWIEVEAPLRGNWRFVDHFRSQWSSLWEFWNLTWKGTKGEVQSFAKIPWSPECCVQFIERQSRLCCRLRRLLPLLSDSNTSTALAHLLGWLTLAWADGYLINKTPGTAIAVFWCFYYILWVCAPRNPAWNWHFGLN